MWSTANKHLVDRHPATAQPQPSCMMGDSTAALAHTPPTNPSSSVFTCLQLSCWTKQGQGQGPRYLGAGLSSARDYVGLGHRYVGVGIIRARARATILNCRTKQGKGVGIKTLELRQGLISRANVGGGIIRARARASILNCWTKQGYGVGMNI